MACAWKDDWDEARAHHIAWWRREGLVLAIHLPRPDGPRREGAQAPAPLDSADLRYTRPRWRARQNHYALAGAAFPADTLPIAGTDIGPGSLALLLGSTPRFDRATVWYEPCMAGDHRPERRGPLRFEPDNRWWRITEATVTACAALARGRYLVGCPDLIENLDTLASLRGTQQMLLDLVDRPAWVAEKLSEINEVWFEAYRRIYQIIRQDDGGAAWGAFSLWGPGKTAKVQCDAAAMISPATFERLVLPALSAQCAWLDFSMFHLDGSQCLGHLEALLGIEALDAIEWTPEPGVPHGGSPHWYNLYRRILAAGKAVQAIGVRAEEVVPLLDAVGGKGMYIRTSVQTAAEAAELIRAVQPYRERL